MGFCGRRARTRAPLLVCGPLALSLHGHRDDVSRLGDPLVRCHPGHPNAVEGSSGLVCPCLPLSWRQQLRPRAGPWDFLSDQQVCVSAAHDVAVARGDGTLKEVSAFSI